MLENKVVMNRAIALAEKWQRRADELVSDFDKKFHIKMNKMLTHPQDKVLLIELMDQSFRTKNNKIERESEEEFIRNFKNVDRIIYSDIAKVSPLVFSEAAKIAKFIIRQKTMMEGRLELLNYLQEQSISHSYHRYGNLGARGIDKQ